MKELIKPNALMYEYNSILPDCEPHSVIGCEFYGCACWRAKDTSVETNNDIIF